MFYVYVLYSEAFDKTYAGFTGSLEGRLAAHNHPSNKGYTKRFQPWKILHSETYHSKKEAMERERFLKSGAGRELIQRILNAEMKVEKFKM